MNIRAVIIDDEQGARETIEKMLNLYCPQVVIAGKANGVNEGVKLVNQEKPDLLLLDIKMQDGTGFDLLKTLDNKDVNVIFISAHDEYALSAIRFSAIDYLLKPIDPKDLIKAIKKAENTIEQGVLNIKINTLIHNLEKSNKKLTIKTSESFYIIQINEIIRCESEGNYTKFYLEDGNKILVSTTLKDYEDILAEYDFFRLHQSHLINLNQVLRFDKKDGGVIIMKDKSIVPVSIRKKEKLMELLFSL